MKQTFIILVLTVMLSGIAAYAIGPSDMGTVNITVLDENGALVQDAPVYIYGEHKTKFIGGREIPGTTTLEMPAGTYRISSAIVKKSGDYYDRFASHEAHVEIIPGDNTVVVLTLQPISDVVSGMGFGDLIRVNFAADGVRSLN